MREVRERGTIDRSIMNRKEMVTRVGGGIHGSMATVRVKPHRRIGAGARTLVVTGSKKPAAYYQAGRHLRGVAAQAASSSNQAGSEPRVAIVGATGAVGQEFLKLLDERDFPLKELKLLASARSAGKTMKFQGRDLVVEELKEDSFGDVDIALFSAGGGISKKFGPLASDAGAVVVDNSSAFRMTEGVPLVIPEINAEAMRGVSWRERTGGIIANPNCSTIIALMAVTPLHREAGVRRMVVSTYQAASGAGQAAMDELVLQTKEALEGKEVGVRPNRTDCSA